MEQQRHQFTKGQRVRLRSEGQDAVYSFAAAGSPGWVRDTQMDSMGYPTILIEWDKDHWSYNGEPDKWVMEAHFEPDEEAQMDKKDEDLLREASKHPEKFAEQFAAFLRSQGENPDEVVKDEQTTEQENFERAVEQALEALSEGGGFILINIRSPEPDTLIPEVYSYHRTEAAAVLAELQLSKLTAMSHGVLAMEKLRQVTNRSGDES